MAQELTTEAKWALREECGKGPAAEVMMLADAWPAVDDALTELLEALFDELASWNSRQAKKAQLQTALNQAAAQAAVLEVKDLPEGTPADLQAKTFGEFLALYSVRLM